MIRRPPRSTLFPYNDALPISLQPGTAARWGNGGLRSRPLGRRARLRASVPAPPVERDRKSTRLNSSHGYISYAVFCLKKKKKKKRTKHVKRSEPVQPPTTITE